MSAQLENTVSSSFALVPIKAQIGAEIRGLDLAQPLDQLTRNALYDAVVEHVAVVVRDQQLTAGQFAAAAGSLGELMPDQIRTALVDGVPMVSILDNFELDSRGNQAKVPKNGTWHTDHTNKELPPKFTFLYALAIPSKGGGTSVVNMNAAYESLPAERRAQLDVLFTANQRVSSARLRMANPDIVAEQEQLREGLVMHPLVRTHPERGTRALWFHTGKTETVTGMGPHQTQEFLKKLLDEAIKDDYVYTHEWTIGDLLIVDNRTAMHKASADYDMNEHRRLYRTMVRGDRPV